MKSFTIEVVASTVTSCINAEKGGAGRIELCSALATAGITPSSGMLEAVKRNVSIPVYAMIRPREGNFCYDKYEIDSFKREIDWLQKAGADGFVFGLLNPNAQVDEALTRAMVAYCKPHPVTFHRAIDCTPDLLEAMEIIIDCGCERILTSGGKATGPEGIEKIREMSFQAKGRISIMPGGGIRPDTFPMMLSDHISEYHLSGRMTMHTSLPETLFEMNWSETSEQSIRSVVELTKHFFA